MQPLLDVPAVNAVAAGLRQRADALGCVSFRLEAQVAGMVYAGPAAAQFRSNMDERRGRLARITAELQATADLLDRAASTLSSGSVR